MTTVSGIPIAALVVVGIVLVFFGIFGTSLPVIGLGVLALFAGGVLSVWSQRRT
jgi:hypothetical protein